MEKKKNSRSNQGQSKGQLTDPRKETTSNKQFNRSAKRREYNNSSNQKNIDHFAKQSVSYKGKNFGFDKGSRPRKSDTNDGGGGSGTGRSGPAYLQSLSYETQSPDKLGEESEDEDDITSSGLIRESYNEIVDYYSSSNGKKKNWNHLLNFQYGSHTPMGTQQNSKRKKRNQAVKSLTFNKETFIQANCQLVVSSDSDYSPYLASPDNLVDWNLIEQVIRYECAETVECPICLYPLVAAKMNKCGHVFCWPCILHYVNVDTEKKKPCPICLVDCIYPDSLKSAVQRTYINYNVGDYVRMELVCRENGAMYVTKADRKDDTTAGKVNPLSLSDSDEHTKHAKILVADKNEIIGIIERERMELMTLLDNGGLEDIEKEYVHMALENIMKRESGLDASAIGKKDHNVSAAPSPKCERFGSSFEDNSVASCSKLQQRINPRRYFYQSVDGQHLYLHSMNMRMIEAMFTTVENFPMEIECRIIHKSTRSMTEEYRRSNKNLQHLPITCQFDIVEVDMSDVVSNDVLKRFRDEIEQRKNKRTRQAKEEKKRERRIKEENDRQMGIYTHLPPDINIQSTVQFPNVTADDGPFSMSNTMWEALSEEPKETCDVKQARSNRPTFANMLSNTAKKTEEAWPSLRKHK